LPYRTDVEGRVVGDDRTVPNDFQDLVKALTERRGVHDHGWRDAVQADVEPVEPVELARWAGQPALGAHDLAVLNDRQAE
jgi:hypothetical protein